MATTDQANSQAPGNRACDACSRRKSRCDKARPTCSLCLKIDRVCQYPLRRKSRVSRKQQGDQQLDRTHSVPRLSVRTLEAAAVTASGQDNDIGQDLPAGHASIDCFNTGDINSWRSECASDRGHPMSPPDRFPLSSAKWQYDNQIRSSTPPTLGSEGVGSAMSYVPDDPASMDDGVSSNLAVELVNLFFEKIQPWLPLLHRPRFQKKYSAKLLAKGNVMKGLTSGESLLMYGMFALSARFSDHSRFEGIPDSDKGNVFAERATDIYIQSHLVQQPLLLQLQGYLVLAYNQHASGPTTLGRVLVGQCLQVAYALGLHDIDHPVRARHRPAVDHVDREEMRRAWWLLWELDTFASCASGKPFLIDRRRMSVMLPISDEAWFAEREVHSAELILGPGQSWKCLENSPNQDERAWCLATVHLMASNLDRLQQPKALAMDEKLAMQNEIACFKLALPLSANLDSEALKLTPTTISRHNWVIAIHLILMTTSFMVDGVAAFEHGQRGDPKTAMAVAVRKRAITLGGIIRLWDPSCIVLALPFLMCGMIPALAMHEDTDSIQPLISSTNDMAVLVLKRFRSKWKLAAIMLEVAQLRKNPDVVNIAKGQLYQRYTIFFRRPRTEKGILKTSSIEAQTQWPEQTGNNLNASHQAHSQPARDSLGSNPDDIPSSTLRPDALGLDWAGWPNLAVDPLGFPAIQPDLYDLGFDFEPPDQTQNLDSSNLMQV